MDMQAVPLVQVKRAFEKWRDVRLALQRIERRLESQDTILTPTEAMLTPEDLGRYRQLVVSAHYLEFCRQVLWTIKRHAGQTMYEVTTCWDAGTLTLTDEDRAYQGSVLWDRTVIVPGLGFVECLMLVRIRGPYSSNLPIPVDQVGDLGAWAVGMSN